MARSLEPDTYTDTHTTAEAAASHTHADAGPRRVVARAIRRIAVTVWRGYSASRDGGRQHQDAEKSEHSLLPCTSCAARLDPVSGRIGSSGRYGRTRRERDVPPGSHSAARSGQHLRNAPDVGGQLGPAYVPYCRTVVTAKVCDRLGSLVPDVLSATSFTYCAGIRAQDAGWKVPGSGSRNSP